MNGRRKPRVPRRTDCPVDTALRHIRALTVDEIQGELRPLQDGFQALREGIGSETDWALVNTAMNLADAIELKCPVLKSRGHVVEAQYVLQGILRRAMDNTAGTWCATPLYLQEIDDLRVGIELYEHQLLHITYGEFRRAHAYAVAEVRSTGGLVLHTHPAGQQLALEGS